MYTNKMEQILTQKLTISNKIVQSLNILNMGRVELEDTIEKESESNPLLEVEIDKNEIDWEKYFENYRNSIVFDKNNVEYSDDDLDFENLTKSVDSLYDSLYAQISILELSTKEKKICRYLIDSLDKDGYLREDENIILEKLFITRADLENCINIVQSLEPCGIGARSIEECLILQLNRDGFDDDVVKKIIRNDLNLIANLNIDKLCQKYRLKKDEVIDIIEFIKSLDPKPVSMYSEDTTVYAYPDVYVEKINGRSVAKSYNESKMTISINNYYKNLLLNSDDGDAKKYIKDKLNSAKKLINDVNERGSTVVNIANAIIDAQRDYFDYDGDLKPLLMTDIAESLNCHLSTISRGVSDKYMLTDKGIIEFKKFFTNSHRNNSGGDISTDSIKMKIKAIIDSEDKKKPLSDKKIEDMLKEKGIDIARRTVAKYREELGYLGSSKRKKL